MPQLENPLVIVNGVVPAQGKTCDALSNIRDDMLSFAMDQRVFGPRKLLVAFGDADGAFRGLAYTARRDPIDDALTACLDFLGHGAKTAIAFLDEPAAAGQPEPQFLERFIRMRSIAAEYHMVLVDWIACDDELLRCTRAGHCEPDQWWPDFACD